MKHDSPIPITGIIVFAQLCGCAVRQPHKNIVVRTHSYTFTIPHNQAVAHFCGRITVRSHNCTTTQPGNRQSV